jgi:hypothetical protein
MEREDRRWRVPDMAAWELRALILAVFEKILVPSGTSLPLRAVIERLQNDGHLVGIINFNYDLSVETSFGGSDCMPFYYPILSNINPVGKLPLRGSLNWQPGSKSVPRIQIVSPIGTIDHAGDWYKQPEIIGPNFFKQEINLDVQPQGDFRAPFYKDLCVLSWGRALLS